jgi:hypothetical protein
MYFILFENIGNQHNIVHPSGTIPLDRSHQPFANPKPGRVAPFQGCEIMGYTKPRAALRSALG